MEHPSGHLYEHEGCFIATAAYGTPFASAIDVLRWYRDNSLNTSSFGRSLVKIYYQSSPPFAYYISGREGLRKVVRQILSPIVGILKKHEMN